MQLQRKALSITIAILVWLIMIGNIASAYTVPNEYKRQATNDVELFKLAQEHETEQWAKYILGDMGYRYNVRNYAQLVQRMEYQAKFPKIVRNNLVKIND